MLVYFINPVKRKKAATVHNDKRYVINSVSISILDL